MGTYRMRPESELPSGNGDRQGCARGFTEFLTCQMKI